MSELQIGLLGIGIVVVLVMYIFGGQGLRGFTFAIGLGVLVGTYSSIAIAAPLLLVARQTPQGKKKVVVQ